MHIQSWFWVFYWCIRQGGALTLEDGTGMCHPQDPPFSDHFLALETHFFHPFSSSTPIFWKKSCIFKTNFCQFWLKQKTGSRNPSFKSKISSKHPTYFENLGGTYLPIFLLTTSQSIIESFPSFKITRHISN